jgi:hypothetical protein
MTATRTWFWLLVASGLFGLIVVLHLRRSPAISGPGRVVPALRAAAVMSIQVRPPGNFKPEVRAERTNQIWQLTAPLPYPAEAARIEQLLVALEQLVPATVITPEEIRSHPTAEEDYGFNSPQASIIINQTDYRAQILIGTLTAPGDQLFLRVVGDQSAYVVGADLLSIIPRSADDWRETRLFDNNVTECDRIAVTNKGKAFALERNSTNRLWRMVWPFTQGARADNAKIETALGKLGELRIQQFVSDGPKPALETFGLAPQELDLVLGCGTNQGTWFQFGKSPTNDAAQIYGRRVGEATVFSVAKELLAAWMGPVSDFRDPHLLIVTEPIDCIDVKGLDAFCVQRQTNGGWRVLPDNFAADAVLVGDLIAGLTNLQIIEFVKDNVTDLGWADYGLASPAREYRLKGATDSSTSDTNIVLADLSFGSLTNQPDKVYARRKDERFVYSVSGDFGRLPAASWQLRERKLWTASENDVATVTIRQHGKTFRIIRNGPHQWSVAPGSSGFVEEIPVEETVRGLIQASAVVWAGRGEADLARCGAKETSHQITIELKNGTEAAIEFGGEAASQNIYAVVRYDGQPWIMEFPWILYRDVAKYLSAR